jgi:ribosomal protein S18 acetylase RimI-like enzyme
MKIETVITNYSEPDFEGLMTLWQATGLCNANRGDDHQVILRTIDIGGKLLLLKSLPDLKIIGSSWMTTDGRRLFLHHFGILPEFQGKGLANKLMDESMKFARELGQQFKLEVHNTNHKAIQLYNKFGFEYLGDYDVYIIRNLNMV